MPGNLVLIAGYPRSGTTWTSACLDSLLNGVRHDASQSAFDLDSLAFDEAALAASQAALSGVLVKTHRRPSVLARRHPGVWARVTHVVYVQRHPFDVAISCAKWIIHTKGGVVPGVPENVDSFAAARETGLINRSFRAFCAHRGCPLFMGQADSFGGWIQHLEEWHAHLAGRAGPAVILSYDRLLAEPLLRYALAGQRLGMPWTLEEIDRMLAFRTPERARKSLGDYFISPDPAVLRYPAILNATEIAEGLEAFGPAIRRFGL